MSTLWYTKVNTHTHIMAFSNLIIDTISGTKPVSVPITPPVSAATTPVVTATTNSVVAPVAATVAPAPLVATATSTVAPAAIKTVSGAMPLNMINTAPKVKKKQVHVYKLVLTSIVGSIAAFCFYTVYQSSYNYVFVTYQAGDTLPAVNLDIYALKRTLSNKELQQMALRYKYIPKEALLRAVAMQLPTITKLDTKNWKTVG